MWEEEDGGFQAQISEVSHLISLLVDILISHGSKKKNHQIKDNVRKI